MPKSAKKRKDKAADFSKTRLKLGKGKAVATNAIDTSFKARSIVLPTQSIAVEKDTSEPITRRQLSFGDLISHLKHYNAGTRKDAILGLRELLDTNWELIDSSLTTLVNAVVRIIGDEDAAVRKQLLSFFTWLLPRIPTADLIPHSPLLLLFTTSAQTHIFPEIRIDAIRFLDIFLECIPEAVIAGWCENSDGHGSRVLGGYLGILNAGTKYGETDGPLKATSTSSVVLTPASKLVVLRSFSTFLRVALSPLDFNLGFQHGNSTHSLNAWFMKNAFPTQQAHRAFEKLFDSTCLPDSQKQHSSRSWQAEVEPEDEFGDFFVQSYPLVEAKSDPWTFQGLAIAADVSGVSETIYNARLAQINFIAHLAKTLHSTIIETYLDCAPSVFSPSSRPSETEVQLVVTIARIARSLYHVVLQSSEQVDNVHIEHLESIVNYMAPYFPTASEDAKFDQFYEEYNLIFCELTSLLVNTSRSNSSRSAQKRKAQDKRIQAASSKLSIQTERVTQYVVRRLRGEAASGTSQQIVTMLNPSAYLALLPTMWAMINNPSLNQQGTHELMHATLDHALKVTSKSACKRLTIEFVARLNLLGSESPYQGEFKVSKDPAVKAKLETWFLHLPQVLWELGSANLPTTETTLRILLRTLQRQFKPSSQSEIMASLQSRLLPYFYINHPNRGPLSGPFRKLPSSSPRIRLLALDVMATILSLSKHEGENFEGLSRAVGSAVSGEEEEQYWAHVSCSSMNKK
ncbi:hypothetical protein B0H34DRAFT_683973 [Crassisporium funariophilum]|nr:hypothetical protein B0H34DRAFT_683973 [Crassisporium funariophilum]